MKNNKTKRIIELVIALTLATTLCLTAQSCGCHEHAFKWTEQTAPTCEKAGTEIQKCDGCAETGETREIPALGHDAADEWTVTKEATCTEAGEEARLCKRCGAPVETRQIETIEHTPGEWEVTDDGQESGVKVEELHCTVCDEVIETKKTPNEDHEHTYGEWTMTKNPTCTEAGEHECVCTGCGDKKTEEVKALGHMFGEWETTKEATCGAEGSKKHVCSACGEEETETIPALSHTFGEWKVTKAATCTEKGEQSSVCSICGKTETKEIAKVEHTWKDYGGGSLWKVTKAATCVEAGEKMCECTVCGHTSTKAIPATGAHTYGAWNVTKQATTEVEGVQERTCSACGHKETQKIAKLAKQDDPSDIGNTGSGENVCPVVYSQIEIFDVVKKAGESIEVRSKTNPNSFNHFTVLSIDPEAKLWMRIRDNRTGEVLMLFKGTGARIGNHDFNDDICEHGSFYYKFEVTAHWVNDDTIWAGRNGCYVPDTCDVTCVACGAHKHYDIDAESDFGKRILATCVNVKDSDPYSEIDIYRDAETGKYNLIYFGFSAEKYSKNIGKISIKVDADVVRYGIYKAKH